jgi:hypothetical protein
MMCQNEEDTTPCVVVTQKRIGLVLRGTCVVRKGILPLTGALEVVGNLVEKALWSMGTHAQALRQETAIRI